MIEIKHLTRDYGQNKGLFDCSLTIQKGEVFGILGPNGAGKTTLIRHLMGFIQAKSGDCSINGFDCFHSRSQIQENLGYIPGEISFFNELTGTAYLHFLKEYKDIQVDRSEELINYFELNPHIKIKKMSKGMKQKLGIISAFMHDPSILILDEPTSGLDPLMQKRFINLILQEKERGKTILLSSHIFDEIQRCCDRIGILRQGQLIQVEDVASMRKKHTHTYVVMLDNDIEAQHFAQDFNGVCEGNKVTVTCMQSLESVFMEQYGGTSDESCTL